MAFFHYILDNPREMLQFLLEHCQLTLLAVFLSVLIGVPLGIGISYIKKLRAPVLGSANVVQAIPSLALLGFLIPFLGIGAPPAIFMVVVYSLLPIIKNTATGLDTITKELLESATGIGMTPGQVLFKVKIPLALPVIMAGVRISAVTAVGLVTIAALIGAGGLGYLVYSGIRTVNTAQILAGAIPACLLALSIDFIAARIEKFVSPIPLRGDIQSLDTERIKRIRRNHRLTLACCALILGGFMGTMIYTMTRKPDNPLILGSKDFTEQILLGHLYAELIEAQSDIRVIRKFELGGTQIIFGALQNDEIDLYVEYLGTAYNSILKQSDYLSTPEVYEYVQTAFEKQGIRMFPAAGFNNTYVLALRPETAQRYNLATISDLAQVSHLLTISPTFEFLNRFDGFPGLCSRYGMQFKEVIPLEGTPRYLAVLNGQSDVLDAASTDGMLKQYDLVLLEDDLQHFPPYYTVPLVKPRALKKFPELAGILEMLGGQIDDETMLGLNYQVDVLKQKPRTVAREFLKTRGFLP